MSTGWLATRRTRRITRLGHLRACLPAAAVAAAAGAAVATTTKGPVTAAGLVLGVVLAAGSFALGAVVVDAGDRRARGSLLYIGLGVYLLTVLALGVLVLPLAGGGGRVVAGLPWGVLLGVGAWVPVQSWWVWTSPTPYVELAPPSPAPGR